MEDVRRWMVSGACYVVVVWSMGRVMVVYCLREMDVVVWSVKDLPSRVVSWNPRFYWSYGIPVFTVNRT